jgi:hypothetical protein
MKKDYALNDDSIVIGTSVKTGKIQLSVVFGVGIALLLLAILIWANAINAGENAIAIGIALFLLALGVFVIAAFGFFRMEGVEGEKITITKDNVHVSQKKGERDYDKALLNNLSFKHSNKLVATCGLLLEFKDGKSLYFGFLAIPEKELPEVKEKLNALWADLPKESH